MSALLILIESEKEPSVQISYGLGSYTLSKTSNEEVAFFPNSIAIAA